MLLIKCRKPEVPKPTLKDKIPNSKPTPEFFSKGGEIIEYRTLLIVA